MAKIHVKFNNSVLKVVDIDKDSLSIGRNAGNDIQIDNLAVSNFHARVEKSPAGYCIEDLKSTNGTFINDRRITRVVLNDNDAVTIGKHTLVFFLGDGEAGAAPDPTGSGLDQTMILDTRAHRERLVKAAAGGTSTLRRETIGVFTVFEGEAGQCEFELTDRLTLIGKHEGAGVKLDGLQGSKIGGFVARDRDLYTLIPPDSSRTIIINGQKVNEGVLLEEGDEIEVGGVKMRFHMRAKE